MRSRRPSVRARSACSTTRSEEHTSELQSQSNLVCRLLLEKKKNQQVTDGDREHALAQHPVVTPVENSPPLSRRKPCAPFQMSRWPRVTLVRPSTQRCPAYH